jgi:F0F1-type ATP synthase membrane subunit b/b'
MEDIINKLAEIEAAASHIMEDVSEQKKQLAQQYEEAVQKFDANIDMEIQNRSDTIRQELEIQMKKELENQRNESEQILTQLEAYYTKCHTNMAKEIYDRILRM